MNQTRLYRRLFVLSGFLLFAVVCFGFGWANLFYHSANAASVTWVGSTAGTWETGSNWSTGVVPTTDDLVTISSSTASIVVTLSSGQIANFSTLTIGGDATYTAEFIFDGNINSGVDITVATNGILTQQNRTTQTITGDFLLQDGGLFSHTTNTAAYSYKIHLNAKNITIEGGGVVNVDSKGFASVINTSGNGPGPGIEDAGDIDGSGGAHGGDGGDTNDGLAGGTAYCDVSDVATLGSSGGSPRTGIVSGAGGGLAILIASDTATINGSISAIAGDTFYNVGGYNGGGGGGGCVRIEYGPSTSINSGDIVLSGGDGANSGGDGLVSVVQVNTVPTITSLFPTQTSASVVTVTTTIADTNLDRTSLILEYSLDNSTWVSSTLGAITFGEADEETFSSSTGSITSIDTNVDGSVDITIEWDILTDLPNTDDASVYFRMIPSDTITSGITVTSSAFAVDTADPTVPSTFTSNSTTTASFILAVPITTSTDTNFSEYKIFYSTSTPVTVSDSSITSSTNINLGDSNFNSSSTVSITGLSTNTLYYVTLFAYDNWGNSTSSASEFFGYTLAASGQILSIGTPTTSTLPITIDVNGNPSSTTFAIYNATDSNYLDSDGAATSTAVYQTTSTWGGSFAATGLSLNTAYQFQIESRNGDGITSTLGSASDAVYTLVNIPGSYSGEAESPTQIDLSWTDNGNPDGTEYYLVDRSNIARKSGWVTVTSFSFEDLSCDTTYSFGIRARNGAEEPEPTVWSFIITETEACTGGLPPGNVPEVTDPIEEDKCKENPETCKEYTPTGLIDIVGDSVNIVNGKKYTNSKDITLELDTNYANSVWLIDSEPLFAKDIGYTIVFNDALHVTSIPETMSWSIQPGEGKHCVNAKFRYDDFAAGKSWQTDPAENPIYACVVLDTIAPNKPSVDIVYTGYSEISGKITRPPIISGESELGTKVIVKVINTKDKSSKRSGGIASLHTSFFSIASLPEVYTVETNSNNRWKLQFYKFFEPGNYEMTVVAVDEAGNESVPTETEMIIEYIDPCAGPEPLPLVCKVLDDKCQGPNPPESCLPIEDPCLGPNPPESCFIQPVVDPIIPPSSEGLTSPNGGGAFSSTPKETKDVTISEEIIEFVENALEAVVIGIVDTIEFIGKTIDNPVVEKINEKVVVPTIAAVGVANVAVGFQLPNILVYLRYLFSQPFLLMRRRKQKKWGVVYDAFTKQPIDLVTVRIVEKDSGSIVRTQVTDSQGRFFLILDPGSYKIETHRNGYVGFSEYLKHNKEDSNYSHIYHGEDIEVTDESIEMNYNIPLDPEVQDHTTARILKEHTKRFIQRLVSLLGIIITGASVVISPSIFIGVLFLIHIFIYLFFRRFALKKIGKNFGRVVDAITQTPLGKVVVRVFDQGYNKLIGTTVTGSKGRYAVLVGPSVYYTTYEKGGYDVKKSDEIDFSSEKTGGLGGIIVRDEKLSSMSNKKDDATPVKSRRIKKMNKRNKHRRVGTPSILQRKKGNGDIDKWKEIAQYGKKDS